MLKSVLLSFLATSVPLSAAEPKLTTIEAPTSSRTNSFYVHNREPLVPSAFIKLPIGSITPKGWLRRQLDLEATGMIGHLEEISKWCNIRSNAWADPKGQGHSGWEELPYWLKGYGDLGYVLKDEKIIRNARKWIEAVLSSQESDGWFGPQSLKTSLEGKPDLWPHMVMCNVLQTYQEFSGDGRVVPFLTKYFQWLNQQPGENFGAGYWPKIRFGDNIESIYWVYNRTGEPWLLELAKRIHEHMARWDTGVVNWHNVNIAQGFREPGVYYLQSRDRKLLQQAEKNYETVMDRYGQFPGGGFGGDENCRPGYTDPRQGFETCGMVEFMHSFEMLTKISGNPVWSDRCEEIAFNSLPAALTPDLKGLHYLTCANQVQLDRYNKAPAIENGGTMFSYSPYEVYRCCQHNVSHGWPYYAEELWVATPDNGLCASLYSASEVSARVGSGTQVTISEETEYPFNESVAFRIKTARPGQFPLYLRIPGWCEGASVEVNGKSAGAGLKPLTYVAVDREWRNGDKVTLHLPMKISVKRWPKNNDAASVNYGPLAFSLKIGEKWSRYGRPGNWPEYEVLPERAWNYGLIFDQQDPAKSFEVRHKRGSLAGQPFAQSAAPIELHAKAKRIAAWNQDSQGMIGKLQASPVKSEAPPEQVILIPMGAARLRVTSFPVIGEGSAAHEWVAPKPLPVSASHCFEGDTIEALIDGKEPSSSSDKSIPRFTWWNHRGTTEWVQQEFEKPRTISSTSVYWFDDTGGGACRVPASWQLLYREGNHWKPVQADRAYGTEVNKFNSIQFKPVESTALRIEVRLQPQFSGGILEWKAGQ